MASGSRELQGANLSTFRLPTVGKTRGGWCGTAADKVAVALQAWRVSFNVRTRPRCMRPGCSQCLKSCSELNRQNSVFERLVHHPIPTTDVVFLTGFHEEFFT